MTRMSEPASSSCNDMVNDAIAAFTQSLALLEGVGTGAIHTHVLGILAPLVDSHTLSQIKGPLDTLATSQGAGGAQVSSPSETSTTLRGPSVGSAFAAACRDRPIGV